MTSHGRNKPDDTGQNVERNFYDLQFMQSFDFSPYLHSTRNRTVIEYPDDPFYDYDDIESEHDADLNSARAEQADYRDPHQPLSQSGQSQSMSMIQTDKRVGLSFHSRTPIGHGAMPSTIHQGQVN